MLFIGCSQDRTQSVVPSAVQARRVEVAALTSACAECHAEIVSQYARSGMSHSWRHADALDLGSLPMPGHVDDLVSGYRYEVVYRDDVLWQIETHADDPAHRVERRAEFVVGSGQHASAWVASENGYLTELPVGWFADRRWRMNPGYELKNQRFSRPITSGCVACHATGAVNEAATANRFSEIRDGIECSRCHGDAAAHVAYWKAGDGNSPAAAQLVHPGRLSADRANDVCLQCHLQGDVSLQLNSTSPLDFQPGQRLLDTRHDFLISGQPELLGVASHGARMLQSRCYLASGAKLTCIHCHDPHRPVSDFSIAEYDRKCLSCHAAEACSREDDRFSEGGCVRCHMAKRPTREGLHLVFTDHAILRRPRVLADAPSVLPPNANVKLISAWPGESPSPAALGAAHVVLHETMGPQEQSLETGRELLSAAVEADPQDVCSHYWLGSALLALGHAPEARQALRRVLQEQPAWHQARYRLGLAAEAAGERAAAIAHYQRLLADAPAWTEPALRLAQLELSARNPAEAARVLRHVVQKSPSATIYASLALAERLAGATHEQALAIVNQALARDSREPAAYVTRGTLYLLAGNMALARVDFERASALDPGNIAAQQALRGVGR